VHWRTVRAIVVPDRRDDERTSVARPVSVVGRRAASVETFRSRMLVLRGRTNLTQQQLASRLGVSTRTIQYWETGISYPAGSHLKGLIATFLELGAFTPGRELEQAQTLWESVSLEAPRLAAAFDAGWFETRQSAESPPPGQEVVAARSAAARRQDWGQAPEVRLLHGRATELELLRRWVVEERCRLVVVLGMGGIGKTALATRLATDVADDFDVVYWRSLRLGLPPQQWLAGAVAYLSENRHAPATNIGGLVQQLLELLGERRCLLVLDNFETVLESRDRTARYRQDYGGYAEVLTQIAEVRHDSCLLGTSREKPPGYLDGPNSLARSLSLGGLDVEASRDLLKNAGLAADQLRWRMLVERYGGNALALKIVAETIDDLFGGDVEAFLTQTEAIFGDIRRLLDEQLERLSALETEVAYWLALEHEPVTFASLLACAAPRASRGETLEALESLRRRSLVERGEAEATFTLPPVVQEYVTERIVSIVAHEISTDEHDFVRRHPLVRALAKDWVRRGQEALLAEPVLRELERIEGSVEAVGQRLMSRLAWLRSRPLDEQGWASGTMVNLLRLRRGELRGVDLSQLNLRQVYLQQVETQDASLAGARLVESLTTDAFNFPRSVALSSDGAYVAAGTSNGEVRLWRSSDRAPLIAAQAHTSMVFGLAISADGRTLASGGADGLIHVWSIPDGRELGTLRGHSGMVYALTLSGDGALLLSAGLEGNVRVWDVRVGVCRTILRFDNSAALTAVALSADRRLVASGGLDGRIALWDLADPLLQVTLQGHAGAIRGVALDATGRLLASAGDDGHLRLWDTSRRVLLVDRDPDDGPIYQVALCADGSLCLTGAENGVVRAWETSTGHPTATLAEHTNIVFGVDLTSDGRTAASAGLDGTVRLWDVPNSHCLASIHSYLGGVRSVSLSADGALAASGRVDGTIRLWSARNGTLVRTLRTHPRGLMQVVLGRDGELLCAGGEGPAQVWSLSTGRRLSTLAGHTGMIYGMDLPADSRFVATCGVDGTVRLWDPKTGGALCMLGQHTSSVNNVAVSGDGRLLATPVLGGTVELWSTEDRELLVSLAGPSGKSSWGIALSEDGRVLACGGEDGIVRVWDVASQRLRLALEAHEGGTLSCALSHDGRHLASSGGDGRVRLWSVESGQAVATWHEHAGGVWGVDLSGDGRVVLSGGLDGTTRVWSADRSSSVHVLRPDRPYERMDITGLTGVTEAQRMAMLALGAVDHGPASAGPAPR
jgi:WD40 repeat protein/transcriptional regulator with XRE-family HTH domain